MSSSQNLSCRYLMTGGEQRVQMNQVLVGLSDSEAGVNYQLYFNGMPLPT
ncbi:MAG: hypothetical protein IPF68_15385 [Bacteroidales bacterium]|nr:hypothetical protein [Bacteroidales bacterium]